MPHQPLLLSSYLHPLYFSARIYLLNLIAFNCLYPDRFAFFVVFFVVVFCFPRPGQGGFGAPFNKITSIKAVHDTATKITRNNVPGGTYHLELQGLT